MLAVCHERQVIRMTNTNNVQAVRPLLEVNHISKYYSAKTGAFSRDKRVVKAVEDISFKVYPGETIGIVGESGCGKTIIGEPLLVQKLADKKNIEEKVEHMLEIVGLNSDYSRRYPFECSGGQRQRVGIARALILNPKLIVCDEAVSALDVSTQSQIINLLDDIQKEFNLTYLFISHGLSVVRHICSRVMVMYLGRVVEIAECEELYYHPRHPYTQALFSAIPLPDPEIEKNRIILEGDVPNPVNVPIGCAFHTRCKYATDQCRRENPPMQNIGDGHSVACHLVTERGTKK